MNDKPTIRIIAHRGGGTGTVNPDAPPENTAPAFRWADEQGCAGCECDVRLSRDGEVVVFHDVTAKRTAGVDRPVAEMTLAELRRLDVGRWKHERWTGTRISTLDEVIGMVPSGATLLVEIKPGPVIIEPLSRIIRAAGDAAASIILMSFNLDTIRAARAALPDITCLWIIGFECNEAGRWCLNTRVDDGEGRDVSQYMSTEQLLGTLRHERLDGVDVSADHPPDLGPAIHDAGLIAGAWTVNDAQVAAGLIARGVTWITTDMPVRLYNELTACGHTALWLKPAIKPI